MAYDEGLAQRIRESLGNAPSIGEKKMFGGLCFTLNGHMMVGIVKESLMARVGEAAAFEALSRPGARPMDFTGKPMKGYLFVDPVGITEDHDLEAWIALAKNFVASLPAKNGAVAKPASRAAKAPAAKQPAAKVVDHRGTIGLRNHCVTKENKVNGPSS